MSQHSSPWTTTPPEAQALLAPFRSQIDALDTQIVALLGQRFAVVRQVAALKSQHGIPPVLRDRLHEVADRARAQASAVGLDPVIAARIYNVILDAACALEDDVMGSTGEAGAH